jgi:hypothetical protein
VSGSAGYVHGVMSQATNYKQKMEEFIETNIFTFLPCYIADIQVVT